MSGVTLIFPESLRKISPIPSHIVIIVTAAWLLKALRHGVHVIEKRL